MVVARPVGGAQTTGPSQHLQALRCLEQLDYDGLVKSENPWIGMIGLRENLNREAADVHPILGLFQTPI